MRDALANSGGDQRQSGLSNGKRFIVNDCISGRLLAKSLAILAAINGEWILTRLQTHK